MSSMDYSKNEISDLVQSREVNDVRRVERFVPEVLMQKIIDDSWTPSPCVERRTGAVMMADISGYTRLTEQLSTSTGAGYESLVASLNRYFDKISEEIYAHGGDVIKFAGDALLVAFYTTEIQPPSAIPSSSSSSSSSSAQKGRNDKQGCKYISRFHEFPETSQDVLSAIESCLRCEANLNDGSQKQICACCNIICCSPCCSNEVFDETKGTVRLACDHCFSASKTIKRINSSTRFSSVSPLSQGTHRPAESPPPSSSCLFEQQHTVTMHLEVNQRPPFFPDDTCDDCMICKVNRFHSKTCPRGRCGLCGSLACPKCLPHIVLDTGEIPEQNTAPNELTDGTLKQICSHCRSTSQKLIIAEGLKEVTLRCAECALRLVTSLDGFEGLRLHAGVGAGEVLNMSVGQNDRWEMLLAGDSLSQMSKAAEAASAGEVCLSRESWALIASRCNGERVIDSLKRNKKLIIPTKNEKNEIDFEKKELEITVLDSSNIDTLSKESLKSHSSNQQIEEASTTIKPKPKIRSDVVKLLGVRQGVASVASQWRVVRWNRHNRSDSWKVQPSYALSCFLHYVPRHIRPLLVGSAGSDLGHLALSELRTATVLFINLPDLGFSSVNVSNECQQRVSMESQQDQTNKNHTNENNTNDVHLNSSGMKEENEEEGEEEEVDDLRMEGDEDGEELLSVMQTCMSTMQRQVQLFEGTIRQFLMDDKGTTLIAVFGLSPSHENDPLLACSCALGIQHELSVLGHNVKIGITTGKVFAGILGGPLRCEYSVVGATVNFSARLMSALVHPENHDKRREEEETESMKRASSFTNKHRRLSLTTTTAATILNKKRYSNGNNNTTFKKNVNQMIKFKDINILVDENTASRASNGGLFMISMSSIQVKGKAEPMKVYTPKSKRNSNRRYTFLSSSTHHNQGNMVMNCDDLLFSALLDGNSGVAGNEYGAYATSTNGSSSSSFGLKNRNYSIFHHDDVIMNSELLGNQKECYDWLIDLLLTKNNSFVVKIIGDVGFGKSLVVDKLCQFASLKQADSLINDSKAQHTSLSDNIEQNLPEEGNVAIKTDETDNEEEDNDDDESNQKTKVREDNLKWIVCHHSCRLVDRGSNFGVLLTLTLSLLATYHHEKNVIDDSMLNQIDEMDEEEEADDYGSDDDVIKQEDTNDDENQVSDLADLSFDIIGDVVVEEGEEENHPVISGDLSMMSHSTLNLLDGVLDRLEEEEEDETEEKVDVTIHPNQNEGTSLDAMEQVVVEVVKSEMETPPHPPLQKDYEKSDDDPPAPPVQSPAPPPPPSPLPVAVASPFLFTGENPSSMMNGTKGSSKVEYNHTPSPHQQELTPSPTSSISNPASPSSDVPFPTFPSSSPSFSYSQSNDVSNRKLPSCNKSPSQREMIIRTRLNTMDDAIDNMARTLVVGDGDSVKALLEALLKIFTESLNKGVLFFIDDAQWCDFKSFDVLNKLAILPNKLNNTSSRKGSTDINEERGSLNDSIHQNSVGNIHLGRGSMKNENSFLAVIYSQRPMTVSANNQLKPTRPGGGGGGHFSRRHLSKILEWNLESLSKEDSALLITSAIYDKLYKKLFLYLKHSVSIVDVTDELDELDHSITPSLRSSSSSSTSPPIQSQPFDDFGDFDDDVDDNDNDDDDEKEYIDDLQKELLFEESKRAAKDLLSYVFAKAAGVPLYTLEVLNDLIKKGVLTMVYLEDEEEDDQVVGKSLQVSHDSVKDQGNNEEFLSKNNNSDDVENKNHSSSNGTKLLIRCEVVHNLLSLTDDSPSSLEMIVGSKLDSLSAEDQWVARCASVLDHVHPAFDLNTLKHLLGTPSNEISTPTQSPLPSPTVAANTSNKKFNFILPPLVKHGSNNSDSPLSSFDTSYQSKPIHVLSPMEALHKSVAALVRENILSPPEIPNEGNTTTATGSVGGGTGGARLSFRNPLAAASSYGRIPLTQRAGLHRRAGSTLAEECGFGGRLTNSLSSYQTNHQKNQKNQFNPTSSAFLQQQLQQQLPPADLSSNSNVQSARYRSGVSFNSKDGHRSSFGFFDLNNQQAYDNLFGAASIGEKIGEGLINIAASKFDGGKSLCKDLSGAAAHFLLGGEVWYSLKCWAGSLSLSMLRFAYNDTLRVATSALGALSALSRYRNNSLGESATINPVTKTGGGGVNPLLSATNASNGESNERQSTTTTTTISTGTSSSSSFPAQLGRQYHNSSMRNLLGMRNSASKDEEEISETLKLLENNNDEDNEVYLILLMLCRILGDTYLGRGEPTLAKPFLKLLLEASMVTITSTSSSTSIKRMKTSRLLSYATALVSDPTESRLSTFIFDDENVTTPSPTAATSTSIRPSLNTSNSIYNKSRTFSSASTTTGGGGQSRLSNLNDNSLPYVFGSDISYKGSSTALGYNLKKNEISKLCSRIDIVLRHRANGTPPSKNTQQQFQHKTLFEELIGAERIKGMSSFGRICLEDGDLYSALLYSLDALEQYNLAISTSSSSSNPSNSQNNDQQFDSRISVLCLSTIALASVVVLGPNGSKISERCCGRAVAIAMVAATTSPTSLADALLAKCHCSLMLGNLSSAADDGARANDILKSAKFIDPRRVLCVATVRSQVLIISGALAAAGDVTKESQANNESKPIQTNSSNNNRNRHHHASVARLRPSIQKTTLSRFFLAQHGGDEPNGLTNNDFMASLTNAFRLLDIDIDDAFHVTPTQESSTSSSTPSQKHVSQRPSISFSSSSSSSTSYHHHSSVNDLEGSNHIGNDFPQTGLEILRDLFNGVKALREANASNSSQLVVLPKQIIRAIESLVAQNATFDHPSNNVLIGFAHMFAIEIVIACIGDDFENEQSSIRSTGSSDSDRGRRVGSSTRGNTLVNAVVRTFARARSISPQRPRSATRTYRHSSSASSSSTLGTRASYSPSSSSSSSRMSTSDGVHRTKASSSSLSATSTSLNQSPSFTSRASSSTSSFSSSQSSNASPLQSITITLPAWYHSDMTLSTLFSDSARNYFRTCTIIENYNIDPLDSLFIALDNLLESFKNYSTIYKIFTPARLRLSGTRHWLNGNKDSAATKWARALLIAQQKGTKIEEAKIQLESYLRLQHDLQNNSNVSKKTSSSRTRTMSNLSSGSVGEFSSSSSTSSPKGTSTSNVWKDDPRVTSSIEVLNDCGALELVSAASKLTGSQGRVTAVILSGGPIETL